MIDRDTEFEVFPLVFDRHKFSFSRFYSAFLSSDVDEIDFNQMEPAQKLEDLSVRIKKKEYKKRELARVDFAIDSGVKVGVKMYSLFKKFKKAGTVVTDQEGVLLRKVAQARCAETNQQVPRDKVGSCVQVGDEKVLFTKEEVAKVKSVVDLSFALVGFRPRNSLKVHHNLKESVFVVADDQRVLNSSKFTDALIKEMIALDRVAIVKLRLNKSSSMRFGALIPQQERGANESDFTPNGFHLIVLPFANELRQVDLKFFDSGHDVTDEELAVATELVSELTVDDFDPRNFENPAIQKFYRVLQALSLQQDEIEPFFDSLEPDVEGMESKIDVLRRFNLCFYGVEEVEEVQTQIGRNKIVGQKVDNQQKAKERGKSKQEGKGKDAIENQKGGGCGDGAVAQSAPDRQRRITKKSDEKLSKEESPKTKIVKKVRKGNSKNRFEGNGSLGDTHGGAVVAEKESPDGMAIEGNEIETQQTKQSTAEQKNRRTKVGPKHSITEKIRQSHEEKSPVSVGKTRAGDANTEDVDHEPEDQEKIGAFDTKIQEFHAAILDGRGKDLKVSDLRMLADHKEISYRKQAVKAELIGLLEKGLVAE
jgi:hypothetical protein